MSIDSITIEPALNRWPALASDQPNGLLFGKSLAHWRERTRQELSLPIDRLIIGTGHQPALWHPGILVKYLAVDAIVRSTPATFSAVNIIVDQDIVECAAIDVPQRHHDASLVSRKFDFAPHSQADTPVGLLPAFEPQAVHVDALAELPQLAESIDRIRLALAGAMGESSAAAQAAAALMILMGESADVAPMPRLMASALMRTSLANEIVSAMASQPHRCAEAYNRAIAAHPDARIPPLAIREDYVELPLWRVRDDLTRARAYDADVESQAPATNRLLPRALLMTAIIRIGVVDLFVHGRGGATYDLAMEQWIRDWLGVEVSAMAVASADVRLPLMSEEDARLAKAGELDRARGWLRRLTHDPEAAADVTAQAPGRNKVALLDAINSLPLRSRERRSAFFAMHEKLEAMRREHAAEIQSASARAHRVERLAHDAATAMRRDWCFALHPRSVIMELRNQVRSRVHERIEA